jgi:plasmid stabilization system protein ParE
MRFTVIWQPPAQGRLAEIWINTDDRQAVTAASHRIDQLLKTDPQMRGESRSRNNRVLVVPPLAVYYDVNEEDRTVHVLTVRKVPRRPPPS